MDSPALAAQLEARTRELAQAADQLAATSEVLRAISNSRSDPAPVLKAVAEHAARLCDADISQIFQIDGELLRVVVSHGPIPSRLRGEALRITRGSVTGRAVIDRRTIHVHDLSAELDTEFPDAKPHAGLWGHRTTVATPLLREGAPIGAIFIRRTEVRPFTDQQLALLETFADQAGIAIEQVRLVRGLEVRNQDVTEALEQQTATAEILKIISSSPTDIQPVLDAVAKSAARLCDASDVIIRRVDGDVMRLVAHIGSVPVLPGADPKISRTTFPGRAILERRTIHIHDVLEPRVREEYPDARFLRQPGHFRTTLCAPLLREDTAIGAIVIRRPEMRPFSDKQIKLLETFAAQSVIAIENVRLFNETKEALERQTATAEILGVISSSPTDLQPVFDAILERALRLCDAHLGFLGRYDGERYEHVAHRGVNSEYAKWISRGPFVPDPRMVLMRALRERQAVQLDDLRESAGYREGVEPIVKTVDIGGARTVLAVPMVKDGRGVGCIFIFRPEVRPFTQKQIDLVSTFASQAVIAIENVRLFNETKEALEQQTVISEILRVISSSPTEVQPVFDAIVKSGVHLFGGLNVSLRLVKGDQTEEVASTLPLLGVDDRFPLPLDDDRISSSRSILRRDVVQRPDLFADDRVSEEVKKRAERRGYRAVLSAPMLREGRAIGAITVMRASPGRFTDKEVALLKTFADQAVIAIENVRLFKELQARNADITEALEQQTATAEILRIISTSPTDVTPVLDAVARRAAQLCESRDARILLVDGDIVRRAAGFGEVPSTDTLPHLTRGWIGGRAIIDRTVVHIEDAAALPEEEYPEARELQRQTGHRTILCVPLLREDKAFGLIVMRRKEMRPFTPKQIELVKTFADQAVIAIENVRLFNETKEALEQQTVISEILRVISSSPTDVQPVFDAIVKSGVHLFGGMNVSLRLVKGDHTESVASTLPFDVNDGPIAYLLNDDRNLSSRAILRREVVQIPDVFAAEWVSERVRERARRRGHRAMMAAPMVRENRAVGAMVVTRAAPGLFMDKQIALLKTFADQAVIAIENVRLFKELQARNAEVTEALEQQTATAEILRVISSSPTDVQPVLNAVAENATRVCDAGDAAVLLIDGDAFHLVAHYGTIPALPSNEKIPLTRGTITGRAILDKVPVHAPDLLAAGDEFPEGRALVARFGNRTTLATPLLREGSAIGALLIRRTEVRPFTDKQIALLQIFADQAVIAIENVRLFNETKEALEQQTATSEILKVISSSPTDVQPVFDAIARSAARYCGAEDVAIREVEGDTTRVVAHIGPLPLSDTPVRPLSPRNVSGRAILERRTIHLPDRGDPRFREEFPDAFLSFGTTGVRSVLGAPLLREDTAVGAILLRRGQPLPFSDKHIKLLETFAAQAVIAIENVRLFKELQARNAEVTEALEQQMATAEILRVISSSPTDTQPVFDAIVKSGVHLFRGMNVTLRLVQGDRSVMVASTRLMGDDDTRSNPINDDRSPSARAIMQKEVVQIPDISAADWVGEGTKRRVERQGLRALLTAPMLRDNHAIGVITVHRASVGPFTQKEVALLKTFADQAVIAIENVRLFKELQARNAEITESLEQQTATSEILGVISSSPTDLQPVFDTILEKATRLCDAHMANLGLCDGDKYHAVAQRGVKAELAEFFANRGPHRFAPDSGVGRMIVERQPIHIPDLKEGPGYRDGSNPNRVALVDLGGVRTFLLVPMLKEGRVVGGIAVYRPEVRPFTQKQIDLVSTFANQAVIAIENVRLFNEINEALQRQTSIAEILRVISDSPTDVMPVLEAVTHRAAQLCDAPDARLFLVDGDAVKYVTGFGESKGAMASTPLKRGFVVGRAIIDQSVMHIEDIVAAFDEFPDAREPQLEFGNRTILAVPLVRENKAFGAILMRRKEVRPFSEKQIELVKTFADQAVIAIENVRLFKELQARNAEITESLEQQTATSEVLKVISRSTFDLEPVLETLVENARKLCNADRATISRADKDGNYFPVIERALEPNPEYLAYMQRHPIRPDRGSAVGRAVLERRPVHIPDVLADPEYKRLDLAEVRSFRTVLAVPMLREGEPIGVFVLTREKEVKPFTEKQVELVTTFADQAVIAIENVRLFNEIQDKSRQLEVASRHKSQFLANMSHELRTPLNAILGYTELVLDGIYGDVSEKVHDVMGRVDKSGRHLLGLINDVLDLSKIEAGQLTLSLAEYSLADVVQTVFTAVESLAAEKKLALKVAAASDLPRGRGDDRRLTQVLLNLVGNAIKFTEAGEVRLEARCSDGAFVVSVADTGPGISEADQQRIFEEFQQVDDSATRKKGGTGLGLSIAKRIIELHGGRIQVESAPGRGSTFTVTLPVRVERQASSL